MSIELNDIEKKITDFWTNNIKSLLFFLTGPQQSLFVSIIHYIIFVFGFYYFFFVSTPGSIFRLLFFFVLLISALCYFIFNKCFFTSIERRLCKDKNIIQATMDAYFGKEIEGNISSKIILSTGTVVTGIILLKDYGFISKENNNIQS